jgi:hypothetical protein
MRNIKQEVEQFSKILYRECPDIENKIEYKFVVSYHPVPVYGLDITFPSKFRDKVWSLSKFCGLDFNYECRSDHGNLCHFRSGANFF